MPTPYPTKYTRQPRRCPHRCLLPPPTGDVNAAAYRALLFAQRLLAALRVWRRHTVHARTHLRPSAILTDHTLNVPVTTRRHHTPKQGDVRALLPRKKKRIKHAYSQTAMACTRLRGR